MDDISTLNQKIEDLRDVINALTSKVETELVRAKKVGIGLEDGQEPQAALDVRGDATVTGEISEGGKKLAEKYHEKGDSSVEVTTRDTGIDSPASAVLQIVGVNGTSSEPEAKPGARIRIGGPTSEVTKGGFRIDRAGTNLLSVDNKGDLHVPGALHVGQDITEGDTKLSQKYQARNVIVSSHPTKNAAVHLVMGDDGAQVNIRGAANTGIVQEGFQVKRIDRTLLHVKHNGDLHVIGALVMGDVTITVEPVELFSMRVPSGITGNAFDQQMTFKTVRRWFLGAPGQGWVATNEKGVALVLKKSGQEPIILGSEV